MKTRLNRKLFFTENFCIKLIIFILELFILNNFVMFDIFAFLLNKYKKNEILLYHKMINANFNPIYCKNVQLKEQMNKIQ